VLLRLSAIFFVLAAARGAEEEPAVPVARAQAARATVWMTHDDSAMDRFTENPNVTRRMVNDLIKASTGEKDVARAWKKLVSPQDRIGIKVNAGAGPRFSTRVGVVRAILDGLEEAGIKSSSVVVWDRESSELKDAGFDPVRLGCQVRGIDPPRGWNRNAQFSAPVLGRLIWGDALFVEKNRKGLGKTTTDADQLSSTSHFAAVLGQVNKIINVATLSENPGCGVGGVFYNLGVKNVDNWRRFVAQDIPALESIPEIYANENIAPKVIVHFLDGLLGQFAGGPEGNPNYTAFDGSLYVSGDPVALDALAARKIDDWRKLSKLPPITRRISWLQNAEQLGLGESAESRLNLITVP